MRQFTAVALAAVTTLFLASPAAADPITLTGGSITLTSFARGVYRTASVDVTGENFAATGFAGDVNTGVVPSCNQFDPCTPGETVALSEEFRFAIAIGSATVDGTTYPLTQTSFDGQFTSGLVTIPDGAANTFTLSSPFFLSGILTILALEENSSGGFDPTILGPFAVTGQGTAVATASPFLNGFEFSSITLNFENASATPEPGSLLLFGTGALMAWRRLRRLS